MSKSKYSGNLSKEEISILEAERKEQLEELRERKERDSKRRSKRGNRHIDWSEPTDD